MLHRGARSLVPIVAHAARVAVVAAIAWLVHAEHVRYVGRHSAADLASLPIAQVQKYLPEAAAIGGPADAVAGGRDLLDAAGERVGTMLRTSPAGDAAIGFSGPTDLLVVCDRDLRVAGIEVLSSRDTRDHVRAVERDAAFWQSFRGKSLEELAGMKPEKAHAVAGATLTSLAIAEALVRRLGGTASASRFEQPPTLADLKLIYPDAVRIEPDPGDPAVIRVLAADAIPLGWALRTSPAADRVIGYQGPTDALVGFDATGKVCGVAVLTSYDNEPYVGYVRDDAAFRGVYRGMSLEAIVGIDPRNTGVEGVSGATMTSQAVAEGIVRAARQQAEQRATQRRASWATFLASAIASIDGPQWGAIGVIVAGIVTAFTRLRGTWFGRLALPIAVLAYLGFGAGALLSQAQLWGWAQAGVARGAVVLMALTLAALVLPITTRRNVYCSHLCAHGAAQQLLVRFVKPKRSVPEWLKRVLVALPWVLLTVAILAAVLHLPLNLVDLEPFDAYLPAVSGVAALVIFAVSLVASSVYPMAYCRHGCPTGALLDHLRLHRRADRFSWRDGLLLSCLAIAAAVHWWPA
ncbi:MAG: FMN-binding protein [Planctomycetia bacterium]|nr:FMN-binding protein [Planctomycetia bacterium]